MSSNSMLMGSIIFWLLFLMFACIAISECSDIYVTLSGICLCLAVGLTLYATFAYYPEQDDLKTEATKMAETENYGVYIDGVEVNIDNIDISQYNIKIDDEKKKIILTK